MIEFKKISSVLGLPEKTQERLLQKVKLSENGCWLWTGAKNKYGVCLINGKQHLAHRVFFAADNGGFRSLKKGYHICHSCDTPLCVNPAHLRCGTPQDNADDRVSRGRQNSQRGRSPNAILNEDIVRDIRKNCNLNDIESIALMMIKYKIHESLISSVLKGKAWAWVKS